MPKKTEAFFICLGDMPMVNKDIYNKLIKLRDKKKEIFVPTFNNEQANPVLFNFKMKDKIMNIKGDFGAKKILQSNEEKIFYLPIDDREIFLDFNTMEDF